MREKLKIQINTSIVLGIAQSLTFNSSKSLFRRITIPIFVVTIGLHPTSTIAVEPGTVAATISVTKSLIELMNSDVQNGLDPKSEEYFTQIIGNQEELSKQIESITDQIISITERLENFPMESTEILEIIRAKSVVAQAMQMERQILEVIRSGQELDTIDQMNFNEVLTDFYSRVNSFLAIVQNYSQSLSIAFEVHQLASGLESMVNAADNAEYNTDGYIRRFHLINDVIHKLANELLNGESAPNSGTLRYHFEQSQIRVKHAVKKLVKLSNRSTNYYYISAPEYFYSMRNPRVWDNKEVIGKEDAEDYCRRTASLDKRERCYDTFNPNRDDLREKIIINASKIIKEPIETNEHNSTQFLLKITPEYSNDPYFQAIENFNLAISERYLYITVNSLLQQVLEKQIRINEKINDL